MIAIEISQSMSTVAPKTPSEGKNENQVGTKGFPFSGVMLTYTDSAHF